MSSRLQNPDYAAKGLYLRELERLLMSSGILEARAAASSRVSFTSSA
jgi:hypothetical protein